METELRDLFSKYGTIKLIVVKRSIKGEYCFAFLEYQPREDATNSIKNLNGTIVQGKPMKVQIQNNGKGTRDINKGCFICEKKGHFARDCRFNKDGLSRRIRSKSNSDSPDYRHRHRNHSDSSDSDRDRDQERKRSRHKKNKERKHSDKNKKKRKHKKKHRYSSDSNS